MPPVTQPTVARADLFAVADKLDAALQVIRQRSGAKTTLDVYFSSMLSTLRRSVLQRALGAEELPAINVPKD